MVEDSRTDADKDPLEALLEEARTVASAPLPPAFEALLLEQAAAVQPVQPPAPSVGAFVRRIWAELGGWPAGAGLAAATLAGLWLGGASPVALDTLLSGIGLSGMSLETYFPDYVAVFEEI